MVHRSIFKLFSGVSLLVVIIGAGCVGYLPLNKADPTTRQNVTEEVILSITPGQTNREEILLKLGEPDEISPDGTRLAYSWKRIKGIAWFLVGYGYGGGGGVGDIKKNYCLIITLDEKGIVSRSKLIEEWVGFFPSFYTKSYIVSPNSVDNSRILEMRKINVGIFTAKDPDQNKIMCRSIGYIRIPFGDSFSEYIREALVAELKRSDLFSLNSQVILNGNLDRIDFDSISGSWDISLTVRSSLGRSMNIRIFHTFVSALFGETGCTLTADAFIPAVQKLMDTLLQSPEFGKLVSD
jgi:hypothetical protein